MPSLSACRRSASRRPSPWNVRGAHTAGRHNATAREIQEELVDLVGSGAVEIPIAATFPLYRVVDAYAELEQRHTQGKIILIP
ncbi:zinc-binding dehydrogenase [Streptacidiphilus sp. EB103A]|uniref:zinc-binding dehydrogenase n=1 Tax=Streptacidiphilus sp. EB103A TaxID=3156275 RepID=UPI003512FC31